MNTRLEIALKSIAEAQAQIDRISNKMDIALIRVNSRIDLSRRVLREAV